MALCILRSGKVNEAADGAGGLLTPSCQQAAKRPSYSCNALASGWRALLFLKGFAMAASEQRVHTRATYFRLGSGSQTESYFVFRDADKPDAIAALVLDISEGGLQILSQAGSYLTGKSFRLQLHTASADGFELVDGGEIQWVWSRPEGIYTRSGFVARAEGHSLATLLTGLPAKSEHVIRCALYPVGHMATA
jgi:hypothetical protein